jgi:choline dehydrogenase-like flavoprotein
LTYDFVVAGGGPAGCVLAARLSENPALSVCMLEAGPDYGPYREGGWPADILNGCELAFSHSWEPDDPDDRSQLRARILGGCSAHNACAILPGAPSDYDEWGPGWTASELEPYLRLAESSIGARRFTQEEMAPTSLALLAGAQELGLPVLADASENSLGAGPFPVNAVGGVRWNAAFAYLDRARERPNLTILAETLVDRVRLDGGSARSVLVRRGGREHELEAGRVVLSAGAYGSPAILLRSGIGPETGLPVGENLTDQPGVGAGWAPTARLQEETARFAQDQPLFAAQVVVKGRSRSCAEGLWDLHLFPATEPGKDELGHPTADYELSAAAFALKPRSRGRLRLRDENPETPPVIEHGFLADEADLEILVDGLDLLRNLMWTDAMSGYAGENVRPGRDDDLEPYIREAVRGYFHPVGTCALGSVVDSAGCVVGFENLYVADASVMPTIPRANTHLSTLAVAEKISAGLSEAS